MLAWLSIFLKRKDYTIEISRKVVTHCRLATNWAPLDTKANGYDMNTQRTTVCFHHEMDEPEDHGYNNTNHLQHAGN